MRPLGLIPVLLGLSCQPRLPKLDAKFDVGTLSLHLVCLGEGSPTVVLDAGLGQDAKTWAPVQPDIARFTRVCAYDRAGMGTSSPAARPHTNRQMADELDSLLSAAKIPGPFVLVGHSMGGVNVRLFASKHPENVAAMVLVDSMTGDQAARFWSLIPEAQMKEFRDGLSKLKEGIDFESLSSGLAEMKSSSQSLGGKALVVLTRGKEDPFPGASPELTQKMLGSWQSMQKELTELSTNRAHVVATNAHHFIHRDAPKLVVVAVREVVESQRAHRALNAATISAAAQ